MGRRFTPPKRVTSPTLGPPLPCKQALNGQHTGEFARGGEGMGSFGIELVHHPPFQQLGPKYLEL